VTNNLEFNDTPRVEVNVRQLLKQYNLKPKKGLGQNFLEDKVHLARIVSIADISNKDTVLEIGPGLGSLTTHLAQKAKKVIAVEVDHSFIPILKEVLSPYTNMEIIHADILDIDINNVIDSPHFMVVANIPYNITSHLIRHLLETQLKPAKIVLTVQYEVAMRICSKPPDTSILALSVQVYGLPSIAARIPAGAFYPSPSVDSAVLKIDLHSEPVVQPSLIDLFFKLIRAGFQQKRKNLRNSLSSGLAISKSHAETLLQQTGIDPTRRAQTLTLNEWNVLTQQFNNSNNNLK
jgi:16S rRNA (adenine1518-N6/adenine1519-N6)-dimethyltransferase